MRKVRSLLSVLLVCCLLVNVVPVKSKAVGATAAVVGVSAAMVAASALIGLGVSPGEDRTVFDNLVQDAVDALSTAGYVAGGLISAYIFNDSSSFRYGVSQKLINFVRDYLFNSGTLSVGSVTHTFTLDGESKTITSNAPCSVALFWRTGYTYYAGWVVAAYTPIVDGLRSLEIHVDDITENSKVYGDYYVTPIFGSSGSSFEKTCPETSLEVIHDSSGFKTYEKQFEDYFVNNSGEVDNSVSSSEDISLGIVFPPSLTISDGYTDWASNSSTIPADEAGEDEDVIVYPIGLGPDYDNTISKPQEDVWAGTSEYEIEAEGDSEAGTGTETGLLSSILSAVKSIPSAFEGWFTDLIDLAGEIGEAIIGLPARIKDALTSLFQDVVNVGQAVVDAVLGIPQAIADVLTAIFVPDQAYVDAKVDAVYAQFPFIQSIIATGEELKGAVSGSSGPPVIYVDLGLALSGDFGSQKVLLTDFSWYEPYKQRVDTLLSAALWALFGWKMFIRLPSIISGDAAAIVSIETQDFKLHREERATVNGFVGLGKKGREK